MKNGFAFLSMLLFIVQLCVAQSTPTPPEPPKNTVTSSSTSCSTSTTHISMNIGKNQNLSLRSDDTDFKLDINFKKINAATINGLLTRHLGPSKSTLTGAQEWSDSEKSYRIRLRSNSLDMSIDKDEMNNSEWKTLMAFTSDMLDELGWVVDFEF